MKQKMVFIIGANGVGKTTLLHYLKSILQQDIFDLHDFDERGVPDNADKNWRISETDYWVRVGEENKQKGVSTIICGFSKPQEIRDRAEIILLDVNEKSLTERLMSRYQTEVSLQELQRTTGKTVEKFLSDNIWVTSLLRKSCVEKRAPIIDTSLLSPSEVAQEVMKHF